MMFAFYIYYKGNNYQLALYPLTWRLGLHSARSPVEIHSLQVGPFQISVSRVVGVNWDE